MKRFLILFTLSYPYLKAAEDTFLNEEISYLRKKYNEFVIVPKSIGGDKVDLDKGIEVDESLAKIINKKSSFFSKILNGFSVKMLFFDVIKKPEILLSPQKLLKHLLYVDEMKKIKSWFTKSEYSKYNALLIYTYWATSITSCFALLINNGRKIVTRVHGADLYEERHNNYIPLRKATLQNINNVFCVSRAGIDYLKIMYPSFIGKYKLARIGVKTKNDNIKLNKEDTSLFRIVSCSGIINLKRIPLILLGVIEFAKQNEQTKIEYYHFGDGPLMQEIIKLAEQNSRNNLTIFFKGNVPNRTLLEFYKQNFVDVFVNASTTEGGCPVAIQEAQSYGIPFIGAKVGGIPEIIKDNNGILISSNPTPSEISDAITTIYTLKKDEIYKVRRNSFVNWQQNFNAEINFKDFVNRIFLL